MPESKSSARKDASDPEKIGNPARRAKATGARDERRRQAASAQDFKPVPGWYKVIMFGLMIVGLLWIVTFYIAHMVGMDIPVPGIGNWNILVGFGVALVGFIMMMGWRD